MKIKRFVLKKVLCDPLEIKLWLYFFLHQSFHYYFIMNLKQKNKTRIRIYAQTLDMKLDLKKQYC